MKLVNVVVSMSTTAAILIASQGCGVFDGNAATREERLCIPGSYVFCRCSDKTEGTKLCKADAKSFAACTTKTDGECVGGEIDDPRTNEPIPTDEDPDPNNNPPDKVNAIDACPGKSTAVQPGVELKIEGDTTTATGDRKGKPGACAVGAGGNDHVYRLIPSGSGKLVVKVQGEGAFDPVIYLRSTCAEEEAQVDCGPVTKTKLAQFDYNVLNGREYFLFVDGASSTAGKYVATLSLATGAFCGDGKVDPGEACDDGNNKPEDDGCSANCMQVNGNPTSGGSCPGHPVDVWAGKTVTGTGSTNSYGNAWNTPASSACSVATDGTNNYQDHVYAVLPHETGNLVVTVSAPPTGSLANHMIAARRVCDIIGSDVKLCANDASIGGGETLTIPVTKNQAVFVAVDGGGVTTNRGDYTISFKLN